VIVVLPDPVPPQIPIINGLPPCIITFSCSAAP
jgi:hypothetical protein